MDGPKTILNWYDIHIAIDILYGIIINDIYTIGEHMSYTHTDILKVLNKWKNIASSSHVSEMIEELKTMFDELRESKIPKTDILKYKDKILQIWIDLTWSEAKRNNPEWERREWWKQRKDTFLKAFSIQMKHYDVAEKKEEKTEKDYFSHMPAFTNVEDLQKWKAKRTANS